MLKSIPERCDPKKTHKNKKDYRKVVLVGGECRSTGTVKRGTDIKSV